MSDPEPKKICITCMRPTQATLTSEACLRFRSADNCIWATADTGCANWKPQNQRWSISEALAFAKFMGLPLSRPSMIEFVREHRLGIQIHEEGKWWVDVESFKLTIRKVLKGGGKECHEREVSEKKRPPLPTR